MHWATDRRLVVEPSPSHQEYESLFQGPALVARCTKVVGDWLRASTPQHSRSVGTALDSYHTQVSLGAQLLSQ